MAKHYFAVKYALLSFPLYVVLLVLLAAAAVPLGATGIAPALLVPVLSALGAMALLRGKIAPSWGEALPLARPRGKQLLGGVAAGCFLLMALLALSLTLQALGLDLRGSDTSGRIVGTAGWLFALVAVFFASMMVPLVEELFFRGFIFYNASAHWRGRAYFWAPALISSAAFSAMHAQGFTAATDYFVLAWIFIMGLAQCALLWATRSIWVCVAAHASYNFFTVTLSLSPWVLLLPWAGALYFVFAIILRKRLLRRETWRGLGNDGENSWRARSRF